MSNINICKKSQFWFAKSVPSVYCGLIKERFLLLAYLCEFLRKIVGLTVCCRVVCGNRFCFFYVVSLLFDDLLKYFAVLLLTVFQHFLL